MGRSASFYLKMRYGMSSKYIKNYDNSPNVNEYSTRLSVYGSSEKNKNALRFYPILTYEYLVSEDSTDDIFKFEALPSGQYILYCYENYEDTFEGYNLNSDIMYPYFGGKWESLEESARFSEVIGPIEVRTNWDVIDIVLKFREPIINNKLSGVKNE